MRKRIEIEIREELELEEERAAIRAKHALELEQVRIEQEKQQEEDRTRRKAELEKANRQKQAQLEKERQEKAIYDKYINNFLTTGSTPYAYCYGLNKSCADYGCSELSVRTPYDSDVIVSIKKSGRVVRHAYIKGGSSYTFELPNGTYQPFFYYGKGWNPEKVMKQTYCGTLTGGFISRESFGKDDPQVLTNTILEYELILQAIGNFSTRPSDANEAF